MGSYYELYVAGYPVMSGKSYVSSDVATLFQVKDKQHRIASATELRARGWRVDVGDEEVDDLEVVEYAATVQTVVSRLEIMGFGLDRARREFEDSRTAQIENLESIADQHRDIMGLSGWPKRELHVLRDLTYEGWQAAMSWIVSHKILPHQVNRFDPEDMPPAPHYVLSEHAGECCFWGWAPSDERITLRAILELFPDDNVVLDCTDLVANGYYDESEAICGAGIPVLVLTEGSTDARILSKSLLVLHPEIADYYSFMDFDLMRVPGGASQLVNAVKVFAGGGVGNRIIAIFDNDTSAKEALRNLSLGTLPGNIRVLTLPDVDIAVSYPTLGPQGLVTMDVNGLACSIELYFGRDVLTDSTGDLIPVQWTGYSNGVGQYQGEVLRKSELQSRYIGLLEDCLEGSTVSCMHDWSAMRKVLEAVFGAFST